MLQYDFNWKALSAVAGVTWWDFYFSLFPGSICFLNVLPEKWSKRSQEIEFRLSKLEAPEGSRASMKRSQFTEEQIVRAIHEQEQGKKAEDIC